MFTMPAGHGLGSGRGLFQAIAGAASVVRREDVDLLPLSQPSSEGPAPPSASPGPPSPGPALSQPRLSPRPALPRPARARARPSPGPARAPARPSPGPALPRPCPGPGPPLPEHPQHADPGERRRTSLPPECPLRGKRDVDLLPLSQPSSEGPAPPFRLPRPRPPPAPPLSQPRLSPGPAPGPGAPLPRPAPGPGPPSPWPRPPPALPRARARPPRAHEPPSTRSLARGLKPAGRPQIYKYSGELDAATELLDRALYCLEAAWHPQFKPASGACRLDFAVMENKAWSSGACRCSFAAAAPAPPSVPLDRFPLLGFEPNVVPPETAKLLLALDPDSDLMGVLQCIDYFALRAREYKFLLELAGAALFLPIALNSSAYALMRVARDGGAAPVDELVLRRLFSHTLDPASPAPPTPSAAALAAALLRQAVLMYPGAVRPLLENYNVKPDSGVRGRGGTPTRAPGAGPPYTGGPSSTTTSRPPASSSRP
eukprot:tig00020908_g15315.t1